ncbi:MULTISPECIES: HAL/PAL/TAL family ammonia-lyase [Klebsiella]|uniref:HAL/PAL/TAL family ammonia-lyase n=1 Tax=Klebsiella TaxID=570 RepID=UPI001BA4A77A|nr:MULTISPECIES: aromatic amino acid ammonia-lyase [Klebsiella]HBQ9340017.1 aromatic amino acid lyase [Klebsiella pneumoniae]HCT5589732.1 aromatic amino acid lyase [Klebsiella pneumoniae]
MTTPLNGSITLGRAPGTVDEIVRIADGAPIALEKAALDNMARVSSRIQRAIEQGQVIYGLTTGVGDLVTTRLSPDRMTDTQLNMLRSHACGVGPDLTVREVRAMMAVTLKSLLQGYSGVTPALAQRIADMLNRQVTPWSPAGGSVGYLIATAHIGLAVFGEGKCWYQGELLPAQQALTRAGIPPYVPGPREGHALVGGTYEITALGCLAVADFQRLLPVADMAGGMCLEAMRGNTRGYDARLHALRPHPGQQETAQNLRRLLKGSEILARYRDHRVQDALSLRCIPQIHGAVRDQLAHCRQIMTIELNSVTDNPLFLVEEDRLIVMPGGNGHGAPTALALDALAVAIAQLSTASQARCDRITNTHLSGLPAFLISPDSGYSGMMIPPYVAAALAGDNRSLAGPASIHTVSTCAGQEDHVSMGVASARKALKAVENAVDIVAIELLCACQALEFHRPLRAAVGSEATLERVRQAAPFRDKDTLLYPDIHALRALIHQGELSAMLQALCEEE